MVELEVLTDDTDKMKMWLQASACLDKKAQQANPCPDCMRLRVVKMMEQIFTPNIIWLVSTSFIITIISLSVVMIPLIAGDYVHHHHHYNSYRYYTGQC